MAEEAKVEQKVDPEVKTEEIPEHVARASEHGWKSLEDYTAAGGDPDMWRGPKAFNNWYDDKKDSKSKLDKMQGQIEDFTKTFAEATKKERATHRKALEVAQSKAEQDVDIDKFKEVTAEIAELDKTEEGETKAEAKQAPEHTVIQQFRASNPHLDKASDSFNKSYNSVVENSVNAKVIKLTNEYKRGLSDIELTTILNEEATSAKKDFPHLFNGRKVKTPPKQADTTKKKVKSDDPAQGLDEISLEIYEHMKQNNPKAAEVFLKNIGS